jgi:YtkA-like
VPEIAACAAVCARMAWLRARALGMSANIEPRRIDMRSRNKNVAAAAVLLGLLWGGWASTAWADVKDYEFQLVQSEMKKGDGTIVAVRLVNKKSGKPVPDAVIFAKRIDMAPDAMQEMTAPLEQLPSTEPGIYRFKTDLMMQGRWRLSLGAKVQGEEGTVEAKLVLKALP